MTQTQTLYSHSYENARALGCECVRRGEEKQGPGPGFVDGAFELLLELPHVADARVVVGRRLPVLGLAARSRLLGLHHLKKKKNQNEGFLFSPHKRF